VTARIIEDVAEPPSSVLDDLWSRGLAAPAWWPRVRTLAPFAIIVGLALWSRLRYGVFAYHDTYGSGDADLVLLRAQFIMRGEWRPPLEMGGGASLFIDPPLISLLLAAVSLVTTIPIEDTPLLVTPIITIAALLALYGVVRRAFDPAIALVSVALIAVLPRFSFDSTEPDKVAYVVGFFAIALYFLYAGQARRQLLVLAGLFMGLSMFSHSTGYLFYPVFALSFVALARGSIRALLDRYVIVALAIPLLFVAAYVWLDAEFERVRQVPSLPVATAPADPAALPVVSPPPPAARARNDDYALIPRRIEHYMNTLEGLARDGFRGSAWNVYFDAIRRQVSTPAYVLAVAGFAMAGALMVWRRRWEMAPLLLWMMVVTLLFAIQYPAFSHRSRYPSYVTPVFVIMAVFAVVQAARLVGLSFSRDTRAWVAAAAAAPVVAFLGITYVTDDNPGLRQNYQSNRQLAEYVVSNNLLRDGDEMLYLGWPAVALHILDERPEYAASMHAFGWGQVPVSSLTPAYLESQNIRYYAHDHTGGDYFFSAGRTLQHLQKSYDLRRVQTFCGAGTVTENGADCGPNFVVLYELTPKAP
jgi:hypothetical protein